MLRRIFNVIVSAYIMAFCLSVAVTLYPKVKTFWLDFLARYGLLGDSFLGANWKKIEVLVLQMLDVLKRQRAYSSTIVNTVKSDPTSTQTVSDLVLANLWKD